MRTAMVWDAVGGIGRAMNPEEETDRIPGACHNGFRGMLDL
jgi:hypothetical protein